MGKMMCPSSSQIDSGGKKTWLRYALRGVAIFIAVGIIVSGMSLYQQYNRPPEEVVIEALEQTLAVPNYTFHSQSSRTIEGRQEKLCEIWGEKNADSSHLVGTVDIVNSKFEIYQVQNRFYRQDAISKEWLVLEPVSEDSTEKLLQEIDPLAVFSFNQPIEAEYLGKEKSGKVNCRKYHVLAYAENDYLNLRWHNFFYTLWIDKNGYLHQAEISAENKEKPGQTLQMRVQFEQSKNYLEIKAPIE